MDDILPRREYEAARPRRLSAVAEIGANVSLQDGEVNEVYPARETLAGLGRLSVPFGRMERRNSATSGGHQRHMPMEPLKFPIPRKTKEKRALFQDVSTESREYEDMMTILTSSYLDSGSTGTFTYCKPRLVHSELLEKEFVEKRREMKSEGRTDKELEESYCFLLADTVKLPGICENGLFVGQSWITLLGNPSKGVYLSRYSDLLQVNSISPGATGEIVIFKVMKGKVKSIYENMKNLLDPTPRFDSHISKNASKVTSLNSYRALELTQQYFYEYSFDELRQRPRQVCPYAVVSFQFKGKDSPLPSTPLAPFRLNSQSAEGSRERAQFTVWTGDLVKGDRVLFQISLRSFFPPFLPHRLPEKLDIGWLMRVDQLTELLPSELFSFNLYNNSQEVVKNGHCCSLLEVTDRSRSTNSVTRLLHELESKRVVLVTPLTERGFLFLLSSVQMATPAERGENWKRCLQALFVFPESRDVTRSTSRPVSSFHDTSESSASGGKEMSWLSKFIPALHHALVKARANAPPELSASVERQAREYFIGLNDSKLRQYPMGKYEPKLDERGKLFPAPKHHRVNMEGYLRSYLYSPALYLLSVARARLMVETHCGPDDPQGARLSESCGRQTEAAGNEVTSNASGGQSNTQKIQQLIDLVLTCESNAENEVNREEEIGGGVVMAPGRKRRLEQEKAERALKFLKASQEPGKHTKIPVNQESQVAAPPGSLASVIGSVGLKDVDVSEDGSELAARLFSLLTGLSQAARGTTNQSLCETQEARQRESCPFDRLATKLGLPTNCDIDLRKQEELEEQMAGSVSSLEGFSPSSHSGDVNHHGGTGRGGGGGGWLGLREGGYEEEEEEGQIPWVLIPITGLCSERYTHRDGNIHQDPRFQHLTTAPSITTATKPSRKSPTPSPEPSLPPSPSQCPSPDPSPLPSPFQCPSPEPSSPPSPSQCPSPEPSPPPPPSRCPSPQPSPTPSPSQCSSLQLSHPSSTSRWQSLEPNEHSSFNKDYSRANEEQLAPTGSRKFSGVSKDREEKPQVTEKKNEELCKSVKVSSPKSRTNPSPPPTEREEEDTEGKTGEVKMGEETKPLEKGQTQSREEVGQGKQEEEEVVVEMPKAKQLVGGSLLSPSVSSPPLRQIDSIVDKHLGDFSSEIQLVLQEESIHYSFPQSPQSTSDSDATALQHTLPHMPISQFSQYVSFYNPRPPVQDYVNSLHDSINSMLTELDDSWPCHRSATSLTDTDATLASEVSAFVSSIRAANPSTSTDDDGLCGDVTAAGISISISQSPALSRGREVWQPHTIKQFPDAANDKNPPTSSVTLSGTTSRSVSAYKPGSTAVHRPSTNTSPQSHWIPQQSHTSEINRTGVYNSRQMQDNSITRTAHCTTGVEGAGSLAGAGCEVILPGFSGQSKPLTESSRTSEPVLSPAPVLVPGSGPSPPAADLSSVISQLQPEVLNNLVEIVKDLKKNSLQFYLHSTEPEDQVSEDVKEYLLKQGNVEQSPMAFLDQENSDNRLLVIIKNKDIAGHVHKIPGLVSLKRHPNVVFVGIDTLDDIRNNSYNELFVSGGCIVSDELVLNPDYITHDRLTALLMLLEQHSSPERVWRWKVHYKTHKKLKEQSRFRREAANLLDLLSAYQKRQIVEFLPYHHCDMMSHHSPDLDCLMELQARYTQYRHTVLLTERHSLAYPSGGIVVASTEEILHDFTRLFGCHDIKVNQPITDDMLASKASSPVLLPGLHIISCQQHIHPLSSHEQPQHLLQQSGSSLPPLSHLSDQLVPDSSCKDGVSHHSGKDFEDLRLAISQLRAERQAQLLLQQHQQQLDPRAELGVSHLKSFLPNHVHMGSHHTTSLLGQGGPTEQIQLAPGKKAATATLESIHSGLQRELGEEEMREVGAEGWRSAGNRIGGAESGDQRDGTPVRLMGSLGGNPGTSNSDTPAPSSSQNTAAVSGLSNQKDSSSDRREKADQQGEAAFSKVSKQGAASSSATACPVEGDRSRDKQVSQEQPVRREGAPPGNSALGAASSTKGTGSTTTVRDHRENPNPAVPTLQHIQERLNEQQQLQQNLSHLQQPPHRQRQRGVGLLQPPRLPQLHNQHFSSVPLLAPLGNLGSGLLGPSPVWPGASALVWGLQQDGRDFTGSRLLAGYHNSAGQGGIRYRGGQRGGFSGM
uniref:uncharacterized protein tasora isoform X2 n=1 Tax=Scatophagus argus TaxID=75038 RepID=UPI001ED803D8|nr:uncharacterized protein tasora isoform X2 [Scatophagus argus]